MDEIINEDYENNMESAEILLYYYLILADYISIIICAYILNSKNKIMKSLKYKLFFLFVNDSILSLISIFTYYKKDSISNELFLSLLYSCEFLLIIISFHQIMNNYKTIHSVDRDQADPYKLCTIFLFLIISYEKLFSSIGKLIIIFQITIVFKFFYKLQKYLNYTINVIKVILQRLNKKHYPYEFLSDFNELYLIFIIFFYSLKIIKMFIENRELIFYAKLFTNIIKIACKLFIFCYIFFIFYGLNNYLIGKEKSKINCRIENIEEEKVIINTQS